MNGTSKTWFQPNWLDTASATSSPASADGPMPYDSRDGPTIVPSGPDPAHASLSARQARAQGLLTSGTCGPPGTGSSRSAALTASTVSKLQVDPALCGSILYRLTWKRSSTPSRRLIYRLRASAQRTFDNACGGWPTPTRNSCNGVGSSGRDGGLNLQSAAQSAIADTAQSSIASASTSALSAPALSGWPTATANDALGSDYAYSQGDRNRPVLKLGAVAKLAGWATPAARDHKSEAATDEFNDRRWTHPRGKPLSAEATLAGWPTPCQQDGPNGGPNQGVDGLPGAASLAGWATPTSAEKVRSEAFRKGRNPTAQEALGETLSGSPAETGSGGQLNQAHSRWLMGYPEVWTSRAPHSADWQAWQDLVARVSSARSPAASGNSADTATQSIRTSRRRSSERQKKV